MKDLFRVAFAFAYLLGLVVFTVLILRFRARRPLVEHRVGCGADSGWRTV